MVKKSLMHPPKILEAFNTNNFSTNRFRNRIKNTTKTKLKPKIFQSICIALTINFAFLNDLHAQNSRNSVRYSLGRQCINCCPYLPVLFNAIKSPSWLSSLTETNISVNSLKSFRRVLTYWKLQIWKRFRNVSCLFLGVYGQNRPYNDAQANVDVFELIPGHARAVLASPTSFWRQKWPYLGSNMPQNDLGSKMIFWAQIGSF